MLHLLPAESATPPRPVAFAEAVSRLASVRHALRLVAPFAGGPGGDVEDDDRAISNAWTSAGDAQRALFDRRAEQLVIATAAGLEALLKEQAHGQAPPRDASRKLVEEIRRDLKEIARVVIG